MPPKKNSSKRNKIKSLVKEFWLFSRPHLPSVVTCCALITSFSSIFFALQGSVGKAIICTLCGGFLDAADGWLARKLNACSAFGAEMDSLADLVSFGVSPAVVVYLTQINGSDYATVGWMSASTFVTCMAIRLARFNVTHADPATLPSWSKKFFKGVPAPAGAAVLFAPIYVELSGFYPLCSPKLYTIWYLFVASLLISNIRTFSVKSVKLPGRNLRSVPFWFLLTFGTLVSTGLYLSVGALNSILFWKFLVMMFIVYMTTIPLSHMFYLQLCKSNVA